MHHAFIGRDVNELPTPCLVLDAVVFEANLVRMAALCSQKGIALRPHVKSHKCPTIAHQQLQHGAVGVCAATIGEAEVMAYAGIQSVFIANELVTTSEIRRLVHLCQGRDIMVAVDSIDNLKRISVAATQKGVSVGIIADLDVGMNRCGVKSYQELERLILEILNTQSVQFKGVMGYEGHMALVPDTPAREAGGRTATTFLVDCVRRLRESGITVPVVTGGGTGTYQHYLDMEGVTEIEAGSYIFMDKTYSANLGTADFSQSLFVLGTVISRTDKDMVINVGLKAISPERSTPLIRYAEGMRVDFVQEEHLKGGFEATCPFVVGDTVFAIPSHCCTTVNLYDTIFVFRDGIVEAAWPVSARRA